MTVTVPSSSALRIASNIISQLLLHKRSGCVSQKHGFNGSMYLSLRSFWETQAYDDHLHLKKNMRTTTTLKIPCLDIKNQG